MRHSELARDLNMLSLTQSGSAACKCLRTSAQFIATLVVTLLLAPRITVAAPNEFAGLHRFEGVASCSSSNCHGSVSPRNVTAVLQNEYTTWSRHDAHSKAWVNLGNEDSQRIAKHLGLGDPQQEPLCLKCHSTFVPPSQRGEKFRLEDGVSCERCHGGAEHFLQSHVEKGATHADNLTRGMVDLVAPATRAPLCLSCHYGTSDQAVTHRLIGSGHPRLTFELDTFTALEPVHWEIDDDYIKRKAQYDPIAAWFGGQVVRAREMVAAMSTPERAHSGKGVLAGPELTLLYCYTCHHGLGEKQWKTRAYDGAPGELRLNVSSLLIVEVGARVLHPELAQQLSGAISKLPNDESLPQVRAILMNPELTSPRTGRSAGQPLALIAALAACGAHTSNLPYEVAEQIAMGISSAASAEPALSGKYKRVVDQMYQALSTPDEFSPEGFKAAAEKLLSQLK